MSGLTYFDLVEDEHSASMNDEMIFSMKDTSILSPWPTVLTILSHGEKGSGGGAGLSMMRPAKIRMNINSDPLDFRSAMRQDYIN